MITIRCFAQSALLAVLAIPAMAQRDVCAGSRNLRLTNGKIHTMDAKNSVVNEVTIYEGRIAYVGPAKGHPKEACMQTIDLHGRTAVPGLIDNHNHIVLFGLRPGHDIRIESATTIAEAQALWASRAKTTPAKEWVTTIGDWSPLQFKENRLPTLQELDAAVPDHPLFAAPSSGGAVTNSLGKAFFEAKNIPVNAEGFIARASGFVAPQDPLFRAVQALIAMQTPQDRMRGTEYAQQYMTELGVTTNVDMGMFALPGSPDMQDSAVSTNIESANPWTAYDPFETLHREGKLTSRLRLYYITQDTRPDNPVLRDRLLNSFSDFGDDMLKVSGIGEFASPWFGLNWAGGERPPHFQSALEMIARHGWAFSQHTGNPTEYEFTVSTFEKVNQEVPIAKLHWSVAHVGTINMDLLERLKAIGAGVAVHPGQYLRAGRAGSTTGAGPPLRTILASGIHAGAGSDGALVTVLDPWMIISYMVTGRNAAGNMINDGQQISRQDSLRMYTAENGWFTHEEDKMGSIEPGKFGDVAVLSGDYFDPAKVPDDAIRRLKSVLTVVDGRAVYNDLH